MVIESVNQSENCHVSVSLTTLQQVILIPRVLGVSTSLNCFFFLALEHVDVLILTTKTSMI